jgi:hypothetical protein
VISTATGAPTSGGDTRHISTPPNRASTLPVGRPAYSRRGLRTPNRLFSGTSPVFFAATCPGRPTDMRAASVGSHRAHHSKRRRQYELASQRQHAGRGQGGSPAGGGGAPPPAASPSLRTILAAVVSPRRDKNRPYGTDCPLPSAAAAVCPIDESAPLDKQRSRLEPTRLSLGRTSGSARPRDRPSPRSWDRRWLSGKGGGVRCG